MASGKYEAFSQLLLNYVFNGSAFSQPSNIYIALFSVTPSVSSTGTEATGTSYARITVSVASSNTNWAVISGSTTTVTSQAAFTFAAAGGDWSSASNQVAAGICKSSAGALSTDLWYWGALTEAKPVLNGDTASFASGAVSAQEL
jgi:hypothetical protein